MCRPPGLACTAATAARTGPVDGCADHSGTLNWDWLPGRRRNSTSCWATVCATSRPRSSSTRASARSMPAVTPAEVHSRPSRMKIGSQSTCSPGYSRASCAARPQWLVTRWLVASPAAASRNTPLHTEVTRRAPAPAAPIQLSRPWSARAASTPPPPVTTSVSIPAGESSRDAVPGVHRQPAAGPHRPRLAGHHLAVVGPGSPAGLLEHLVGPGQVEGLEPLEDDEDHPARLHPSSLPLPGRCRPGQVPHTSRHTRRS